MARPLRIEFAGALYHVTSRGNEKRAIFTDEHDYKRRLNWISRTVEIYGWRLHGFTLMTNHDHLFVETPEPNLAAGMQYLNGSYTGYFNSRHGRVGHLFQGRYKAILIENEGHYWQISRYIHLNPVKAGLVSRPEEWSWSSLPGYESTRRTLPFVTYSRVLAEFGKDEASARKAYRQFIAAGLEKTVASPFASTLHGLLLGSEKFVDDILRRLKGRKPSPGVPLQQKLRTRPSLEKIVETAAGHWKVDPSRWSTGHRCDQVARAFAAYLARSRFGYSATQTAMALGYAGPSGVHNAIQRLIADYPGLSKLLAEVEPRLMGSELQ